MDNWIVKKVKLWVTTLASRSPGMTKFGSVQHLILTISNTDYNLGENMS